VLFAGSLCLGVHQLLPDAVHGDALHRLCELNVIEQVLNVG
jgi:hypothetical protein